MSEIRPNFSNSCSLEELIGGHFNARSALASGDYEGALIKADAENDAATFAAALIMCGAVHRGFEQLCNLEKLDDDIKMYQAYAYWCMDQPQEALDLLSEITLSEYSLQVECLHNYIERKNLNILFLCNRNTTPETLEASLGNISLQVVVVDETSWTKDIRECIPDCFGPDLLISYNVVDKELPRGVFNLEIPNTFRTGDTDFGLSSQFDSLKQADIIICNSVHEHRDLREMYCGRIASFPAFSLYRDTTNFNLQDNIKKWDIFLSGNSFIPHMSEKGRLAFRLAMLDDPDLKINIKNGYLDNQEYQKVIGQSKFVPMSVRWLGLLQTRALDAVRYGAMNLYPDDVPIKLMIKCADVAFHEYSEASFEDNIRNHIANYNQYRIDLENDQISVEEEFKNIFPPSPAKEIRLAKFSLFQHSLQNGIKNRIKSEQGIERKLPVAWRTTEGTAMKELSSWTDSAWQSALDLDDLVTATTAAFQVFCSQPTDNNIVTHVSEAFERSSLRFPQSLILAFNRACFSWMCGDRDTALREFLRASELCENGDFDPSRQNLLSHLVKDLQEFMPYQLYFDSVVSDLRKRDTGAKGSRNIILASVKTYLGLNDLQTGQIDTGITNLKTAIELCPAHFLAARLLTKALYANDTDPAEVAKWFYRAVNLHPLYLTELMPFGADIERKLGNDNKAIEIIKIWALFMIRVDWQEPESHLVPEQTWRELNANLQFLPKYIQTGLKRKFNLKEENNK